MITVGYIVECVRGSVMMCDPKDGLLYFGGNRATLFQTRRAAQRAIQRTIADRPTFEQEFGALRIRRLESEEKDEQNTPSLFKRHRQPA